MFREIFVSLCLVTAVSAEPIPPSVRAWQAVRNQVPVMDTEGLSLCKLLSHEEESSFFATRDDVGPEDCDLSNVVLAYSGWCTAGVEDPEGVHFSKSINPHVTIVDFDDGTVIFLNHQKKKDVPRTQAGQDAALRFFAEPHETFDIRYTDQPLFSGK